MNEPESARKLPRAPAGLGVRGRRTWAQIVAVYELRPDEIATLTELCRTLDVVDRLEKELQGAPLVIPGSTGQPRANPLLQELRGHRAVLVQLQRSLGLADVADVDESGAAMMTPRQARAQHAARARWGHRGA